jgi:hypothetical protein
MDTLCARCPLSSRTVRALVRTHHTEIAKLAGVKFRYFAGRGYQKAFDGNRGRQIPAEIYVEGP